MSSLPPEVTACGRENARRAGIDEADGISFAAEAWALHDGSAWRTITFRRCVDQRRRESGRCGDDRRPALILDRPITGDDDDPLSKLLNTCDGGYQHVEDLLDLARVLAPLPDEDLARLARVYWLGLSWASCDKNAVWQSLQRARLGARLPAPPQPAPTPEPAPTPPLCPLTAAELRVVGAIADGHTATLAARTLGLSTNTVKTHLKRIANKIGTANTTHTVATALRHGWIT